MRTCLSFNEFEILLCSLNLFKRIKLCLSVFKFMLDYFSQIHIKKKTSESFQIPKKYDKLYPKSMHN